jgi:threonine/homoserine/homoserine lactone efflux protein
MDYDIFTALTIFAFVSSITPGPNNLMLMNSGANFGFKQTIPHLLGVGIGFTLMIVLVGMGVMQIFSSFPISYEILKALSIIYLVYLALKIARSGSTTEHQSASAKPLTFIQAALFQWVNPKAWTMALTAVSIYAPSQSFIAILLVALIFGLINLPCISSWIVLGQKMQLVLTAPKHLKIFNITMASLLIISVAITIGDTSFNN